MDEQTTVPEATHDSSDPGRRSVLKAVGLGAAALGLGTASTATATAVGGPAGRAPAASNEVNLYCRSSPAAFDGNGNATVTLTIGNYSDRAATGPVSLKVITPFYANIASLPDVPGAQSAWLYQNEAADIPSIVKVTFQGFPANSSRTLDISFSLDPGAPDVPPLGRAVFTTDEGNTEDFDTDLTRNSWPFLFQRSRLDAPAPGNTNLYYTIRQTPLIIGGAPATVPFYFYNGAGTLLGGTRNPSHFTFSTPLYVRVPATGRPAGLTTLYENDDPAIPSVYRLTVPPGLGALGQTVPATIHIPFQAQAGAPRAQPVSSGILLPSGSDTQADLATAHHRFGFLLVRGGPA
ncbi:hypothetical protein ACFV6F_14965 [Kitasatospora phosalacinea]|uniref:hypothetical protein n=1 Tax=Kitasatospora phosalacinea TaxID=2065 RepID=UPI0036494FDD